MKNTYSSIIKTRPFLYLELKKVAILKLNDLDNKTIIKRAFEDNILQLNSTSRIKEIIPMLIKRLNVLDEYLLNEFVNGVIDNSKIICVYTIMKTDRLFFEFMVEVYKEKFILKEYIIEEKDFTIFFMKKSEQADNISKWTDYTLYKINQTYRRILVEANLAEKIKLGIKLIKPVVDTNFIEYFRVIGEKIYIDTVLGE